MDFRLKYGKGEVNFRLSESQFCGEILPNSMTLGLTGEEEVVRALENPIRSKRLRDLVKKGEKIVIVTSDMTRPMPCKTVLPAVLEELKLAGVDNQDITIVFALGIHRKHTAAERKSLVGEEIFHNIRCIDSNPDDCIRLGVCANGTPVDVFREVVAADRRICLGNTEYHYFAGYSGGMKAIMPGVSSREAIQINHSNMVHPKAVAGNIDDNPVRNDIDEVARFLPVDFIVNVVLDEKKRIIKAAAGHYIQAHRTASEFLDSINKISVGQKADIVIVSPGGYPKDINLYQAQKAIDNAKYVVKDDGIIILVASCREGFGEDIFEKWIREYDTPEDRVKEIQKHFELGGHKAAAIALVQLKAKIYFVSDLDEAIVKKANMIPYKSVQEALDQAVKEQGKNSSVYLMPLGSSTLPIIKSC